MSTMTKEKQIIVRHIPAELHKAFRMHCFNKGVTMTQELTEFMRAASSETVVVTADVEPEEPEK